MSPAMLMAYPGRTEYLSCEASPSDPRGGRSIRLRELRADVVGGAPGRPDRPAADRRLDGGAGPTLRRQAVEGRARLLAREEGAVRAFPAVPLRPKVPD